GRVGLVRLPEKGHGVVLLRGIKPAILSGLREITQESLTTSSHAEPAKRRTMPTMQEIELKFQIPALALSAVQAELTALDGGHHAPLRLRAAYFDTPERALAHAHMALRVRQEGRRWVQTLKAGGSNTMMRLEDNQPAKAPKARQAVVADLARHLGTPAETALRTVLGWDPAQDPSGAATGLIELYLSDITRHRARVTVGAGTPYEGVVE